MLSTHDHNRFQKDYQYVYPVVSRRAGGLSLGINLNTNNACNWRCIYCQVPDLVRGTPPAVDIELLERELGSFLEQILKGPYLTDHVPEGQRRLNDIAFSGNGEPTIAPNFLQTIGVVGRARKAAGVPTAVKTVLITNGSFIHREKVRVGLESLADLNGEIWFKVDRVTKEGAGFINDINLSSSRTMSNLALASRACPTWLQTCLFRVDGVNPSDDELSAYKNFIRDVLDQDLPIKGILLYGLARTSCQPEAPRLSSVENSWFEDFAEAVRELGVVVKLTI